MSNLIVMIIYGVIYIPLLAVGFACMILGIMLMRRGIVALDYYIEMN